MPGQAIFFLVPLHDTGALWRGGKMKTILPYCAFSGKASPYLKNIGDFHHLPYLSEIIQDYIFNSRKAASAL